MSVLISVLGAGVLGALLGFLVWTVVVPKFLLTNKDYRIINNKFSDVWDEMQSVKGRVRKLEDAEKERSSLVDAADLRPGDSVAAWDSSKKQWRSGHVNERYGLMALVVTDDGDCLMASKVRRL